MTIRYIEALICAPVFQYTETQNMWILVTPEKEPFEPDFEGPSTVNYDRRLYHQSRCDSTFVRVVLYYKDHAIIEGECGDRLGLELAMPMDSHGTCLYKMPVTDDTELYTDEEMSQISACIDADNSMLANCI